MSEKCKEDCNTCGEECVDRKEKAKIVPDQPHELSKIKKVIGIVSGKGGVGKSLVTSMLAVTMNRRGYHCAILDADITGPSIPKAFGIHQKASGNEYGMFPISSSKGIDVMSINLLLPNVTDPVIWRGPLIGNMVKQFWTDVIWTDVDYMFIDMPPGTGDVALTVFQSVKVDGIVIVTSPQELVSMIVAKAVNMANMMHIPIIGIVENMSYFKCPDNDKNYYIFGESKLEEVAAAHHLKILSQLPIDPKIAVACDYGKIETYESEQFESIADILEGKEVKKMKIAVASENNQVTEHFGHCESFHIFDVENDLIIGNEIVANPGHKPGFLPNFLNDRGVHVIISGGMGGGAIDIFNEKGIEVIVGAMGNTKSVVELYLKGMLKSSGSVCHEHQHHDECGNE